MNVELKTSLGQQLGGELCRLGLHLGGDLCRLGLQDIQQCQVTMHSTSIHKLAPQAPQLLVVFVFLLGLVLVLHGDFGIQAHGL